MKVGTLTVTLLRRVASGTDPYGGDTHTTTEISLPGCDVQPRVTRDSSRESSDGRAQVITGMWLYAPLTETITATDQVRVGDLVYEVDGDPGRWQHGPLGYQQVALRRVRG